MAPTNFRPSISISRHFLGAITYTLVERWPVPAWEHSSRPIRTPSGECRSDSVADRDRRPRLARSGPHETAGNPQPGRFPVARSAQQAENLTGLDGHVDVVQDQQRLAGLLGKRLGDIAQVDDGAVAAGQNALRSIKPRTAKGCAAMRCGRSCGCCWRSVYRSSLPSLTARWQRRAAVPNLPRARPDREDDRDGQSQGRQVPPVQVRPMPDTRRILPRDAAKRPSALLATTRLRRVATRRGRRPRSEAGCARCRAGSTTRSATALRPWRSLAR